jgi:hypothetical protein
MSTRAKTATAFVFAALTAACSSSGSNDRTTNGAANGTPDGGGPNGTFDAGTFPIDSPKPAFQVKSSTQLYNSVKACMGDGMMIVTADMILNGTNPAPILPASFTASTTEGVDDIVSSQRVAFDGDPTLLRQGTRADSLTLQYVTAQRNMANVVARNCLAGKNPQMCNCGDPASATALLSRCLPQLDPTSGVFETARAQLQIRCTADKAQAIASFLASAAIAKLP